MAVEFINKQEQFTRLSSDADPVNMPDGSAIPAGSKMLVVDTGLTRIFAGGQWQDYQANMPMANQNPSGNITIPANYSVEISDSITIPAGKTLTVNAGGVIYIN